MRVERPEGADWVALEEEDEEQNGSEEDGEDHHEADDPHVKFVGCDSEQEEADADFEETCGEYVEDFAEEPVLRYALAKVEKFGLRKGPYCECCLSPLGIQVLNVFAGAVNEPSELTSQICSVQKLRAQHRPVVRTERFDHARPYPDTQANTDPCDDEEGNADAPDGCASIAHCCGWLRGGPVDCC